MHTIDLVILFCLILTLVESFPSSTEPPYSVFGRHNKVRPRFRRRELVQEEVRKTMLTYMTSLKGEITDVVLEEMIDYYNSQTSKLYRLEKELSSLKNSSLPTLQNGTTMNDLIVRLSKQQRSFASNISSMEYKIKNLTNILNDLLNELQKPVQHVRRLISIKKDFDDNEIPIDCDDIFRQQSPFVSQGIYRIKPRLSSESFDVQCIFENNTGWTVIQRRMNGTIDFYRGWDDYKNGFGDLRTEFWLGNEKIHQLTNQGQYILHVDITPWDSSMRTAEYEKFALDNENENYKLQISQYQSAISTAGDSLSSPWDNANGASFSTFDRDHDNLFYDNCALTYHGAWWFTSCFQSHLNGAYVRSPLALQNTARNGLHWNTYALYHSMKESTIRIRRKHTSETSEALTI
ncbi:unnamed protein product [Rotaria socialis]|uniref:Fibrinogen C-terminal domain-containing protein n=1 Tax=Rotaria socialis TaxID=392032 RepID=A0A819X0K9_9BILA|nr:unnamed protein product [Rotaria socialis]CAF3632486.1 unnamed protein product [Rotaria socialis]CAF3648087.1 unnamed protein product [Rotaria socialis]CAF3651956.1 unnamed protein product [Rotaria socialis]CAF3678195.1 unnamed protein product [Rotaria socialis]